MIKKYNQFVKENKTNEEFDYDVEAPVLPSLAGTKQEPITKPDTTEKPAPTRPTPFAPTRPTPFAPTRPATEPGTKAEYEGGEEEEVAVDKYEVALQSLADLAGVEFNPGEKSVIIDGKEVTYPAETEKYHIRGIKKSFNTPEDVLANLGGSQNVPSERKEEVKDEMSSIKDEEFLDSAEQFESKSYKYERYKK
jgi:hypothetical protein